MNSASEEKVIRIQKLIRGKLTRRRVNQLRITECLCEAELYIHLRDDVIRKYYQRLEERVWNQKRAIEAATIISRYIRGYHGRKFVKGLKLQRRRNHAATLIQTLIRGELDRQRASAYRRTLCLIQTMMAVGPYRRTFVPSIQQQQKDLAHDMDLAFSHIKEITSPFTSKLFKIRKSNIDVEERNQVFCSVPEVGDIVRIIKEGHHLRGFIGKLLFYDGPRMAVIRIDKYQSIEKIILFEIGRKNRIVFNIRTVTRPDDKISSSNFTQLQRHLSSMYDVQNVSSSSNGQKRRVSASVDQFYRIYRRWSQSYRNLNSLVARKSNSIISQIYRRMRHERSYGQLDKIIQLVTGRNENHNSLMNFQIAKEYISFLANDNHRYFISHKFHQCVLGRKNYSSHVSTVYKCDFISFIDSFKAFNTRVNGYAYVDLSSNDESDIVNEPTCSVCRHFFEHHTKKKLPENTSFITNERVDYYSKNVDFIINMQRFARIVISKRRKANLLLRLQFDHKLSVTSATTIQQYVRRLLSLRKFQRRLRIHKAVVKIQSRVRQFIAAMVLMKLRRRFLSARCIQMLFKKHRSILYLNEFRIISNHLLQYTAIRISRLSRQWFSRRIKAALIAKRKEITDIELYVLGTRSTRLLNSTFYRIRNTPGSLCLTKYGLVEIVESNTTENDRIMVYFYGIKSLQLVRKGLQASRYFAILNNEAFKVSGTVEIYTIIIQRFIRRILARIRVRLIIKAKLIARFLQRSWRSKRKLRIQSAAQIQKIVRKIVTTRKFARLKLLNQMALRIQFYYRLYRRRQSSYIRYCSVFISSGEVNSTFHANNTLDDSKATFWCTNMSSKSTPWIVYDVDDTVIIGSISLSGSDSTSSPKLLEIFSGNSNGEQDFKFVTDIHLRNISGWQYFTFNPRSARYWKLNFKENFGSLEYTTLNSIRFHRFQIPKYISISRQPQSIYVLAPNIGHQKEIILSCSSTNCNEMINFHWVKNGDFVDDMKGASVCRQVFAELDDGTKIFHCIKCKRENSSVALNVQKVKCSFCYSEFDFCRQRCMWLSNMFRRHLHEFDTRMKVIESKLIRLDQFDECLSWERSKQIISCKQRLMDCLNSLSWQRTGILRHRYINDKDKIRFHNEGEYYCILTHGMSSTDLSVTSEKVFVLIEDLPPVVYKCRYKVEIPDSVTLMSEEEVDGVFGFFVDDKLVGDVLVSFPCGCQYFGPVKSHEDSQSENRWGYFRTPYGDLLEGPFVSHALQTQSMNGWYCVTFFNGEVYKGTLRFGKFHGAGKYYYSDGSIYDGDWFNGKREGLGVFVSSDKSVFEGEWSNDMIHGEGVWKWVDGSTYIGENAYGKRHGKGVYMSNEQDSNANVVYHGEFRDNEFNGVGVLVYSDGVTYKGIFVDGSRQGLGLLKTRHHEWMYGVWSGTALVTDHLQKSFKGSDNDETESVLSFVERHISDEMDSLRTALSSMMTILEEKQSILQNSRNQLKQTKLKQRTIREQIRLFWMNKSKEESMIKFFLACENLSAIPLEDWYEIRSKLNPPAPLQCVMMAVCNIIGVDPTWEMTKTLLSSSSMNSMKGDTNSLLQEYDIKLCFDLEHWIVYDRASSYTINKIDEQLGLIKLHDDMEFQTTQTFKTILDFVKSAREFLNHAIKIKKKWGLLQDENINLKSISESTKIRLEEVNVIENDIRNVNQGILTLNRLYNILCQKRDDSPSVTIKGAMKC